MQAAGQSRLGRETSRRALGVHHTQSEETHGRQEKGWSSGRASGEAGGGGGGAGAGAGACARAHAHARGRARARLRGSVCVCCARALVCGIGPMTTSEASSPSFGGTRTLRKKVSIES
eukprot:6189063-Pleurochrysis_carterae.AAC.3